MIMTGVYNSHDSSSIIIQDDDSSSIITLLLNNIIPFQVIYNGMTTSVTFESNIILAIPKSIDMLIGLNKLTKIHLHIFYP